MPTVARKHQLEGSLTYHIFNRSNGRVPIFTEIDDFQYFKSILRRYKKRYGFKLYHWVIMSNHYHLLLEHKNPLDISKIMVGIMKKAEDYKFSSAQFYVLGKRDDLTDESLYYTEIDNDINKRQQEYKEFLMFTNSEDDQYFDRTEAPVGYQKFLERLIQEKGRHMPKRRGRPRTHI